MNFRQLACFVAVVDEGSFTRAARAIGIAQPSLSQHIRALEEELNGRLIERLPRGVALTPAGRTLLPGGARRGARGRARPPRRARRARARGRRARDRDRALDGRRPAAALHQDLARAVSRTSASACRSSGTARCSRTPSMQGVADFAIGPLPVRRVGRPARCDLVGGVRDRRAAGRSARRAAVDPARGARRPRVGALPPGSRARGDPRGDLPPGRLQPARLGADVAGRGRGAARVGRARPGARPRQHRAAGDRGVGAPPEAEADPRRRRLRADGMVADRRRVHRRARVGAASRVRAVRSRSGSDDTAEWRGCGASLPILAARVGARGLRRLAKHGCGRRVSRGASRAHGRRAARRASRS